ncbi:MAG TPA: glycoside hydrolase family 3 N-terminal domain-containing protein [Streptosporangiaceae bacterium]|nr:glycoside hydrolase family 3 N-terminal domain-containing protein [Streptosporangiaceae bacterium]
MASGSVVSRSWDQGEIRRLVSRLSLEQKAAQLAGLSVAELFAGGREAGSPLPDPGRVASLRPHGVGHLSLGWFLGHDADSLREDVAAIQQAVRETSPFGIGALVHNEGISGFLHASAAQFPTAWAQAATWDPAVAGQVAATAAADARAAGFHLLFAPVMDLGRDPRWGRVHETYGEDPELAAQLAVAFVRGAQGSAGQAGVLATGKHFLGYAASEGGLNMAAAPLGPRILADEYAEPFRRAVSEAGLAVIMSAYNEVDGLPATASRWLLTTLLRDALGFDGVVVSDYDAVQRLRAVHRTAATPGEAARQALAAGLDSELPGDENFAAIAAEVEGGRLAEEAVDLAVSRVLAIKARVGLIPGFTPAPGPARPVPPGPAEAASAGRRIAERAVVLLSNDGILPLTPGGRRVLVTGPAADEIRVHFGAYTSVAAREMPLGMRAIREGRVPGVDPDNFAFTDIFQTRLPGSEPVFEAAARQLHPAALTVAQALRGLDPAVTAASLGSFAGDPGRALDADEARRAAGDADVIIAVVGERTGWAGNNTAGEGRSVARPALPGDQEKLIGVLAAAGKPVVTVVVSGRPLLLGSVAEASSAVLLAPLLGQEAGQAVADVIYGAVNPSGKLPGTFPRHLGQVPLYHGQHQGSGGSHPAGYADLTRQGPLYAFGHGLSYSTFTLVPDDGAGPAVSTDGEVITARLLVSNSGPADGETVLQLYARDEHASVVRPVSQLIQFQRVGLAAGESRTVTLQAPVSRLHYTLPDGQRGIEAGEVILMAGLSSDDIRYTATLTVEARQ